MEWFHRLLISIDQLLNTVFGGDPDETISSRLGKSARRGNLLAILVCDAINLIDRDHCLTAIEEDEGSP